MGGGEVGDVEEGGLLSGERKKRSTNILGVWMNDHTHRYTLSCA